MGVTKSQVEIFLGGVQNLFGGLYEEISRTKGVIRRGIKKTWWRAFYLRGGGPKMVVYLSIYKAYFLPQVV